jgi:DNA ligase D-like protein (predicted ligase)
MLAVHADEPFDSPDHLFELAWGGVRAMAYIRDGKLRLRGRNGRDLAMDFPELQLIPGMVKASEAILDGEIVVIESDGAPAFDALPPRLHNIVAAGTAGEPPPELTKPRKLAGAVCYQAFDVIWLDGRSLAEKPLWQRKNRLHEIVRAGDGFAAVDFVNDEGVAFFEAVVQRKLEGIVARRKVSTYEPGVRSKNWLEVKAMQTGDFVVGGFTYGGTLRKGDAFGQLLLGAWEKGRFEYVGAVSGGLSDADARQLVRMLESRVIDQPAFAAPPPIARLIYWTKPELVCHVRYSEWSRDGLLRFPIFSMLRPDLDAADCVVD